MGWRKLRCMLSPIGPALPLHIPITAPCHDAYPSRRRVGQDELHSITRSPRSRRVGPPAKPT
eukprot:6517726-Pyramimonas_sp.AAC.1